MIMKFSGYLRNFVCCSQSILIELLIESKHSMPGVVDVLCVFFPAHFSYIYGFDLHENYKKMPILQ